MYIYVYLHINISYIRIYVYIHIHIYIYICIYIYIRTYMYVFIHVYVYEYPFTHVCITYIASYTAKILGICTTLHMFAIFKHNFPFVREGGGCMCIYIYIYIYMYIHTHVCIYTYIFIHGNDHIYIRAVPRIAAIPSIFITLQAPYRNTIFQLHALHVKVAAPRELAAIFISQLCMGWLQLWGGYS